MCSHEEDFVVVAAAEVVVGEWQVAAAEVVVGEWRVAAAVACRVRPLIPVFRTSGPVALHLQVDRTSVPRI
jgi:hypothetical protein